MNPTRRSSLRGRLLRQFLLLGMLPVLMASGAAMLLIAPVMEAQAAARNREIALALRDQLQVQLQLRQRTASLIAGQLLQDPMPPARVESVLQALIDGDPFLQAAYVADARGEVTVAALRSSSGRYASDLVGADLSGQASYRMARGSGQSTWSDTFLSTLTGQVTAVLTVPAAFRSVVLEFSLESLSQSLAELSRGSAVTVTVLDRHGRVIAHPDAQRALRQESMAALAPVRELAPGVTSSGRTSIAGVDYFALALPVSDVGWTILATQRADEVLAPVRRIGVLLLLLLGATLSVAVVAGWRFARRTGREVVRLAEGAQAAAGSHSEAGAISFTTTEFHQVWQRLRELFEQLHVRDQQTQAARQDLQAVLDAATEVAIVATDTEGRVKVFNIGAQRMLDRAPADVLGHLTPLVWHDAAEVEARASALSRKYGQRVEAFEALVIEARHGGYEVRDWTWVRADGRRIEVSLAITSVRSPQGDLQGFLGVAVDVTERRRAAELELSRRTAEMANEAKSDFLSRVSHELRSPLNAMLGYAQLIEIDLREPPTPGQRERVQQIQRAGWHLVQLIDDVLDLSRIDSGQMRVSIEAVDVAAIARHAADLVGAEFRRVDIAFSMQWPGAADGDPVRALADATRLTQVLVNLLGNAAKYNRPGGRVTLVGEVSGARLSLAVRDTGRGMTPAQRERLFEPFDRLGLETSGIAGTGIGLVITRRLIELMQGTLEVASEPGVGSVFTVHLPLAPRAPALPDPRAAAQGRDSASAVPARGDFLYVEDNEVNAQLMRAVLRQRPDAQLRIAPTLASGLAQARERRPDVILLDMHLPDGSGHDMLDAMASDPQLRDVPVIVVSADATRRQVAEVSSRVYAYVTKPINVAEVLDAVDGAMAGTPPGGPVSGP